MNMLDFPSGRFVSVCVYLLLATPQKLKEQTEQSQQKKIADANYNAMEINWVPPKLVVHFEACGAFVLFR